MDRGKKPSKAGILIKYNDKIYMDLREILRESALRYLPAKSLARCNSVCKDWKLQISTPFFAHNQSHSFRSISGLFCQSPGGSISFISHDPTAYGVPDPELKFLPEPVDLLASSNGLLCCRGQTGDQAYYICNPVNKLWKKLPAPDAEHGANPAVVLVFEPSVLNFMADYKLVCGFRSADFDGAYEFEIYSSTDGLWKISSEVWFGEQAGVLHRGGVHVNGVVYWSSSYGSVVGFDLKKNRVTVIPSCGYYKSVSLGVMDGKLCGSRRKGLELTVYILSNVYANTMGMHLSAANKTWEKQHFMLHPVGSSPLGNDCRECVLATGSDLVVFHDWKGIFYYNFKTKETKSFGSESKFSSTCFYVPYVNSLACPM